MNEEQQIWALLAKKLSGEASEAEGKELEGLLRDQPTWHYTYEMLAAYWPSHSAEQSDKDASEKRLNMLRERLGNQDEPASAEKEDSPEATLPPWEINTKRQTSWKKWMVAASVLIIVTGGLLFKYHSDISVISNTNKHTGNGISEITTRYGSKTKITLPDGTTVWLNSGSKLIYDNEDFGSVDREITLVGEGFFDVAHDAVHPFIIHAGKISVKVLGTAFDVKSYPDDKTIEATLIRGSIEIVFRDNPDKEVVLKPHQKLIVFKDDRIVTQNLTSLKKDTKKEYKISPMTIVPADSTVVETSWVQNKLAFCSETFSDLAVQMERWYNVKINFSSSKVKQYRFTGIFVNESLEQALKALQITAPFRYKIEKNEVYIYKP